MIQSATSSAREFHEICYPVFTPQSHEANDVERGRRPPPGIAENTDDRPPDTGADEMNVHSTIAAFSLGAALFEVISEQRRSKKRCLSDSRLCHIDSDDLSSFKKLWIFLLSETPSEWS
jgi:hypothetical protein